MMENYPPIPPLHYVGENIVKDFEFEIECKIKLEQMQKTFPFSVISEKISFNSIYGIVFRADVLVEMKQDTMLHRVMIWKTESGDLAELICFDAQSPPL